MIFGTQIVSKVYTELHWTNIITVHFSNCIFLSKRDNVRRPKVVTSAHSSVRPIVTLAVIFENSFVEARRIILKVSTIQRLKVFMRKTSKIALFMEEG